MLIPVIYKNGKSGAVEDSHLEALIHQDKIKKFLRMDGWAVVGRTRLRGMGGKHDGSRRRKAEHRAKVLAGTQRKRPADSVEEELISFEIEDDGTTTELKLTKNRQRSRSRRR
ncbi:MAG: hypothetical protein JSV13_09850 [Nitrospiraceae bacterium]|jgi:hypothetical protein|nr:MAG: hypothetical protein JSV13_09850 [Nitrospiraceae bacterium]